MFLTTTLHAAMIFGWHHYPSFQRTCTASNRMFATFFVAVIDALPRYTAAASSVPDSYLRGVTALYGESYETLQTGVAYHFEELDEIAEGELHEDEVGVFLIKEIEYSYAEGSSQPDRTQNVELADGTVFELENSLWDEQLLSGSDMVLIPAGSVISSSGTIDIMGEHLSTVSEESVGVLRRTMQEDHPERAPVHHTTRQLKKGSRSVLAVRVFVNDGGYNFTDQTGLSNDIFGNGVDSANLKSQYAACSYDQIGFEKAADRAMLVDPNDNTTDIVNGVVDIKVNLTMKAGDDKIRIAVTKKINSVFGVTIPSKLADHVMYCMPNGTMINRTAYAFVNSWNSVYNSRFCNYLSAQMHEIGHNLNFGHSNENGNYKDQTGMMGYSYAGDDGPLMCFNGAKSWQTGWYAEKSRIVKAGDCFEEILHGIADYNNTDSSLVLVKLNGPSADDMYITYNRKSGVNNGTREAGNLVTVTRAGAEGVGFAESELLAKLNAGASWKGIVSGKNMTVKVLSIDTNFKYARVRISENGTACLANNVPTNEPTENPTPSPSASPSGRPTSSPSTTPIAVEISSPTDVPTQNPTASPSTLIPTTANISREFPRVENTTTATPTTSKPIPRPSSSALTKSSKSHKTHKDERRTPVKDKKRNTQY